MSPQMIEAMRKEAFVQGWMRAFAYSAGKSLADFSDDHLLSLLPKADAAYQGYRSERSPR